MFKQLAVSMSVAAQRLHAYLLLLFAGELLSTSQASTDAEGAQALTNGILPEPTHAAVSFADTYSPNDAPGDMLAPSSLSLKQAAADQAAAADVPEAAADLHLPGTIADRELVTQGVMTLADPAGAAAAAGAAPVVVILVGVPGSGKSTFCARLIAKGNTTWVRVNQDSISNGKRGSKQQCQAAARNAVLAGHSCILDRCHQDAQQRSDFIKLAAGLHCEVRMKTHSTFRLDACDSQSYLQSWLSSPRLLIWVFVVSVRVFLPAPIMHATERADGNKCS